MKIEKAKQKTTKNQRPRQKTGEKKRIQIACAQGFTEKNPFHKDR